MAYSGARRRNRLELLEIYEISFRIGPVTSSQRAVFESGDNGPTGATRRPRRLCHKCSRYHGASSACRRRNTLANLEASRYVEM
jgi:hypothetical protein